MDLTPTRDQQVRRPYKVDTHVEGEGEGKIAVPKFGLDVVGGPWLETTLGNIDMISRIRPVNSTPTRYQQVRRL